MLIASDDDQLLEATRGINPGHTKAEEAARTVDGRAIFSIFAAAERAADPKGLTNFNDLTTRSVLGRDGLGRQTRAVVRSAIDDHQAASSQQRTKQRAQRQEREPHAIRM